MPDEELAIGVKFEVVRVKSKFGSDRDPTHFRNPNPHPSPLTLTLTLNLTLTLVLALDQVLVGVLGMPWLRILVEMYLGW